MFEAIALRALWTRFRKPLLIGLAFALALLIVWRLLVAYGDARYKQGVSDNELAWRTAEAKMHERERIAAGAADEGAAVREEAHAEAVSQEKERINEAVREGHSPIDVLFGRSDGLQDGTDSGRK